MQEQMDTPNSPAASALSSETSPKFRTKWAQDIFARLQDANRQIDDMSNASERSLSDESWKHIRVPSPRPIRMFSESSTPQSATPMDTPRFSAWSQLSTPRDTQLSTPRDTARPSQPEKPPYSARGLNRLQMEALQESPKQPYMSKFQTAESVDSRSPRSYRSLARDEERPELQRDSLQDSVGQNRQELSGSWFGADDDLQTTSVSGYVNADLRKKATFADEVRRQSSRGTPRDSTPPSKQSTPRSEQSLKATPRSHRPVAFKHAKSAVYTTEKLLDDDQEINSVNNLLKQFAHKYHAHLASNPFCWDEFGDLCSTAGVDLFDEVMKGETLQRYKTMAWNEENEAAPFYGEEYMGPAEHDFDFVFVFDNPGKVDEYEALAFETSLANKMNTKRESTRDSARASTKDSVHASETNLKKEVRPTMVLKKLKKTNSNPQTVSDKLSERVGTFAETKFLKGMHEEQAAEQHEFLQGLVQRERRHEGSGIKVTMRCTGCSAIWEEENTILEKLDLEKSEEKDPPSLCPECKAPYEMVFKWCPKCARKCDYADKPCRYCGSDKLEEKVHPIVRTVEDLVDDHDAIGIFAEDLLKGFFIDPRQGQAVDVSPDMTDLSDARRATIDIFLSYFRAQHNDHYYTYIFKSTLLDQLFLCVKMDFETALRHADLQQYNMVLDAAKIEKPVEQGGLNIRYGLVSLRPAFWCCNSFLSKLNDCMSKFLFGGSVDAKVNPALLGGPVNYKIGMMPLLQQHHQESVDDQKSILKKSDSIRLLYDKITNSINIEDMKKWGVLKDYYPAHTKQALTRLQNHWARMGLVYTFRQPLGLIREYFGEHITMYFLFLSLMLKFSLILVMAAVVLTAVEVVLEMREGWEYSHGGFFAQGGSLRILGGKAGMPQLRIVWCGVVVVWCMFVRIKLKRRINSKLSIWGVDSRAHSSVKREQNPRFGKFATITRSELNEGEFAMEVPWAQRKVGRFKSQVGTCLFVLLTTGLNILILHFQSVLYENPDTVKYAKYMSYLLSIVIKVLNLLWVGVGRYLVDHEYWRESLDYDNAIAKKTFFVMLVNTFGAFFYIAFAMKVRGDNSYREYGSWEDRSGKEHDAEGPWQYLTYQMITTSGLYLVFSVYDLISPLLTLKFGRWKREKEMATVCQERSWTMSFIEVQAYMEEYDGDSQNDDYMQILLPFGFVLFFGATLPISVIFTWIYTSLQLRVDAWKLCHVVRRPFPRITGVGMWVWEGIIDMFLRIAMITNLALICFTMNPCASMPLQFKIALFFGMMVGVSFLDWLLSQVYPEMPALVMLARRRHVYQSEVAHDILQGVQSQSRIMKLSGKKDINFSSSITRLRPRDSHDSETLDEEELAKHSRTSRLHQNHLPGYLWNAYWECKHCDAPNTEWRSRCTNCQKSPEAYVKKSEQAFMARDTASSAV